MEQAAQALQAVSCGLAVYLGRVFGHQAYAPALVLNRLHVYLAAVAQATREHAHCVALQGAQVERLVSGGLHFKPQAFYAGGDQLNLLASCQQHAAVGRLDECAGLYCYVGCQ